MCPCRVPAVLDVSLLPQGCFCSTSRLSPVYPSCPQSVLTVPGLSPVCPGCPKSSPAPATQQRWGHLGLSPHVPRARGEDRGAGQAKASPSPPCWGPRPGCGARSLLRWRVRGRAVWARAVSPRRLGWVAADLRWVTRGTGEGDTGSGCPGSAGAASPSPQGPSRCPRGAPRWGRGRPCHPSVGPPQLSPPAGPGGAAGCSSPPDRVSLPPLTQPEPPALGPLPAPGAAQGGPRHPRAPRATPGTCRGLCGPAGCMGTGTGAARVRSGRGCAVLLSTGLAGSRGHAACDSGDSRLGRDTGSVWPVPAAPSGAVNTGSMFVFAALVALSGRRRRSSLWGVWCPPALPSVVQPRGVSGGQGCHQHRVRPDLACFQ